MMFQIAWDCWVYGLVGFIFGGVPALCAAYYVHRIECENKELRTLLKQAGDKIQKFLDARRKGAHITNSRKKKIV